MSIRLARRVLAVATSTTGTVKGRVLAIDGSDVSGALVYLIELGSGTSYSTSQPIASDGLYKIAGVPPGSYFAYCDPLIASPLAPSSFKGFVGFTPYTGFFTPVVVNAGLTTTGISFKLKPAGSLYIEVIDQSGSAIAGAGVLVLSATGLALRPSSTTDSTGVTQLSNVPSGVRVAATAPGYSTVLWRNASSLASATAVHLSPGQTSVLRLKLTAGG